MAGVWYIGKQSQIALVGQQHNLLPSFLHMYRLPFWNTNVGEIGGRRLKGRGKCFERGYHWLSADAVVGVKTYMKL